MDRRKINTIYSGVLPNKKEFEMDIDKMIKGIRITAIVLVLITILAFTYGAIETYKFYHQTPISHNDDMTVQEWTAEYESEIEDMAQFDRDIEESEARLELIYKEADRVMGK